MSTKIKDGNYYVVQSFMVKQLQLKGLEKDLYAIIYGFSQAENQTFDGGLQYFVDWTKSSKQGVIKALKKLQEKELICKNEYFKNGVKFVEYHTTEFNGGIQLSSLGGMQLSLPNNKLYDNKNNNIYIVEQEHDNVAEIVNYLNEKAGTHYKATTPKTKKLIEARTKENFKVCDFKKVIDTKCSDWKGTQMEKYLRPETLFGTKFESYLNQKMGEYNGRRIREDGSEYANIK